MIRKVYQKKYVKVFGFSTLPFMAMTVIFLSAKHVILKFWGPLHNDASHYTTVEAIDYTASIPTWWLHCIFWLLFATYPYGSLICICQNCLLNRILFSFCVINRNWDYSAMILKYFGKIYWPHHHTKQQLPIHTITNTTSCCAI